MQGILNNELTADIIATLYGVDMNEAKSEADVPGVFFDQRVDLDFVFVDEAKAEIEELYSITLNLPFGRVSATRSDWDALVLRVADYVSAHGDVKVRPITVAELYAFSEKQLGAALMEQFKQRGAKYDA